MTDVYFFQKIVLHYRVPLFRRLYQKYGWKIVTSSQAPNTKFLSVVTDEPYVVHAPIRFFQNNVSYPISISSILKAIPPKASLISEFSLNFPVTYVFPIARRMGRIRKLAFHTHGPNLTREQYSGAAVISDFLRIQLFRSADIVATYTEGGAAWIKSVDPRIITVAIQNTIDVSGPREAAASVKEPKRLGSPQIIYCGRLTPEKEPSLLIEVFDRIVERYPDASLVVIGDGECLSELEAAKEKRGNNSRMIFLGSCYGEGILAPWFLGSDIFLLPGAGGLSINHALAYGLPIVTFASGARGAFQGPEIEYVVDGSTGRLVDRGSGAEGLALAILEIFETPGELERLRAIIPKFVDEKLQIETMVHNFGKVDAILRS
jgi:glycosyltransferase involved in cell wall biosynthesis